MAIEISQVNGAGSAILILETTKQKKTYFHTTAIVVVGVQNGIPLGSVLVKDEFKSLFIKATDVTVPTTFATPELLATYLLTNYFFATAGGSPITGYNLEATQLLVNAKLAAAEGYLLELKNDFEAANDTLSGPQTVTTTSVQVLNPVNCKGFKIYNNTSGVVYIRIGTGVLVRSGPTANFTFKMEVGDYYESQPYERNMPISYAADSVLSGNLFITQYFKS